MCPLICMWYVYLYFHLYVFFFKKLLLNNIINIIYIYKIKILFFYSYFEKWDFCIKSHNGQGSLLTTKMNAKRQCIKAECRPIPGDVKITIQTFNNSQGIGHLARRWLTADVVPGPTKFNFDDPPRTRVIELCSTCQIRNLPAKERRLKLSTPFI